MNVKQFSNFLYQDPEFNDNSETLIDTQATDEHTQDILFLNEPLDGTSFIQKNNESLTSHNSNNSIDNPFASTSADILATTSPNFPTSPIDRSDTASPLDNIFEVFTPDGHIFDSNLLEKLTLIDPINAGFLYQFFAKFNVDHLQIQYLKDFHIQTIIPISHIGIMAEFQHNFEIWKQSDESSVHVVDGRKISRNSKVNLLDIISANRNLNSKVNKTDLNNKETKCLLAMIRDYYMNNCDNKMSSEEMGSIAKQIEKYFPGEVSNTYYKTSLQKIANGKYKSKDSGSLVSKWTNRPKTEQAKTKVLMGQCATKQTEPLNIPHIENEDEQRRIQAALKNCSKKPLQMILKDWAMCRDIRLRCLLENKNEKNTLKIVTEWPPYIWPEGNILVGCVVMTFYSYTYLAFFYRW